MRVKGIEGRRRRALIASAPLFAAAMAAPVGTASAAVLRWDIDTATAGPQGGTGIWNASAPNLWLNPSNVNQAWANGNDAVFGAPGGVVTAGSNLTPLSITVNAGATGYEFNETSSFTLKPGTGGMTINESAIYRPYNGNAFLNGNQTWTIASGKVLTVQTTNTTTTARPVAQFNLTIDGGGRVDFSDAPAADNIGFTTTGAVTVEVKGGSTLTAVTRLSDGFAINVGASGTYIQTSGTTNVGTGTFHTQGSGATASTIRLNGGTLVAGRVDGSGNLYLNGGTIRSTTNDAYFLAAAGSNGAGFPVGLNQTLVQAGGGTFNTDGFNVTVAQILAEDATSTGGGITKSGAGTLTLSGANTYTGATAINGGTLSVTNVGALGATSGITVADGAALEIAVVAGPTVSAPLTLNGSGVGGTGALRNTASGTYAGNVTLGSNATIVAAANTLSLTGSLDTAGHTLTVAGGNSAFLAGSLLGSGTLNKTSTALLNLGGDNSGYTGNINVAANTLRLSVPNAAVNSTVDVAAGASVQLTSTATPDRNVAGLTGTGGLDLFDANLVVGGTGASTTYGGVISDSRVNNSPAGAIHNSVTKAGAGTLTLTGISTYVGDTIVSGGTLVLADNAGLKFAIGASGVNNALGGTGAATLAGDFTFDLTGADSTPGASWLIVNNATLAETYAGTFSVVGFNDAGLDLWTLDANGGTYTFSELTGTLSFAPVPEPATLGALAAAAAALLGRRRRA